MAEIENAVEFGSAEEALLVEDLIAAFPAAAASNPSMLKSVVEITLRNRLHDKNSSQQRVAKYLNWREDNFGHLDSQSLESDSPESQELQAQLKVGLMYISPLKMSDGSALLFIRLRKHQPQEYTAKQTLRMWHYVIMSTLVKHPALAAKGFTVINNMQDASMLNTDIGLMQGVSKALSKCMPIRLNLLVFANAPWVIRLAVPVIRTLFSDKISQRLHLLDDVANLSAMVGSPMELLPVELGGQVEVDSDIMVAVMIADNFVV